MSTLERSIRSSVYIFSASGLQTLIQFIRSILLARILTPDDFGIYAFAVSFVVLTKSLPLFGLGGALVHRTEESEGEPAYRVHFTLTTIFTTLWGILIGAIGYQYTNPDQFQVVLIILITQIFDNFVQTGIFILQKAINFKRIAIINLLVTVFSTIFALTLAWLGFGVWSLVSTDIIASMITLFGLYIFRPVWVPKFGWDSRVVKYYLNFGSKNFLAGILREVIDNIDDLWTGTYLGNTSLGFYSRAYSFATYTRRILANPLSTVAASTYAELKYQQKRLSQAFFRVNAFLIRTGFLLSGLLALIAPEFIRLLLGEKWLPMLTAFRLMLVYTMIDPLKLTIASLFTAIGKPEITTRARIIQLLVLLIGLFLFGMFFGIAGVAAAVDLMAVVGISILLFQSRKFVNYSLLKLFAVPMVALTFGMLIARGALLIPGILGSPWRTGAVKTLVFFTIYVGILVLFERGEIGYYLKMVKQLKLKKGLSETTASET